MYPTSSRLGCDTLILAIRFIQPKASCPRDTLVASEEWMTNEERGQFVGKRRKNDESYFNSCAR